MARLKNSAEIGAVACNGRDKLGLASDKAQEEEDLQCHVGYKMRSTLSSTRACVKHGRLSAGSYPSIAKQLGIVLR